MTNLAKAPGRPGRSGCPGGDGGLGAWPVGVQEAPSWLVTRS